MREFPNLHRAHRLWVTATYLVLLVLLIPWYWPEDNTAQLFGFPLWALTSLGVLFITSLFTAWLCLRETFEEDAGR